MKSSFFYSLPPAGNKIPISTILRAIKASRQRENNTCLDPIKDYFGTRNLLYLSSGRASLWLILKALAKLRSDRREVIIPAFTCPAVASAVLMAGFTPVLCDNNLVDYGLSIGELARKINRKTLAVVLVHLFGYPANIMEVQDISKKSDVFLIEDAAQAFGNSLSDSNDSKLGLLGDAGFFSFGRGKPISLLHGGILFTKSEEILFEAKRIYEGLKPTNIFSNFRYGTTLALYILLSKPHTYWIPQHLPFLHLGETAFESDFIRSEGIHLARALTGKMVESVAQEKEIRQTNSEWYSTNLGDLPLVDKGPSAKYPYLRYPLLLKDKVVRDDVLESLIAQGTGAARFYPSPLNELPGLQEILRDETDYCNAKKLSDHLITLPVHSAITPKTRNRIRALIQCEMKG